MPSDHWSRVDDVLNAALDQPVPAREAFVREACGDDIALGDEVLSLLAQTADTGAFLEPIARPARFTASKQIGPYEIMSVIGAGGMGVVYRARDNRLGRVVAIKVLLPDIATSPAALARFEREARAVASLSHPNILTIHDFGQHEGSAYAVMEFLEGPTLRRMLERGALPVRKAVSLAVQIAHGLAAAHDQNLIHRDLKPENIGLTREGQVKILDFGLARTTRERTLSSSDDTVGPQVSRTGVIVGTVGYMSPEQVRGEDVDYRSDLFSFGAVLHEMLTGRRPFGRPTAADSMHAILHDDPPDLADSGVKVPPALERVCRRCLEKHPADRFHSARDLAFALENALVHSSGELLVPRPPRRWTTVAAIVAGSLAVGALAAWIGKPVDPQWNATALTFSGVDTEPAASPDGRQIAYTSGRNDDFSLWIRDLDTDRRRPIVERPIGLPGAHRPRYFADGKRLLYLKASAGRRDAFEVALNDVLPGVLLVQDVFDAEPSPVNGDEIAFVRLAVGESRRRYSELRIVNTRTKVEEPLRREDDMDYASVRWSPDGRQLATLRRSSLNATKSSVLVITRGSGDASELVPQKDGAFGAIAWNGDGRRLIVTENPSAQVFVPGALGRILSIDPTSGEQELLFSQANLFGLFGAADANATIDVAGDGRLVFSTVEIHQNLRECELVRGQCKAVTDPNRRAGTTGYSNDRQPAYSPDGNWVIFSSNRSGDLDIWVQSVLDGAVYAVTRDADADWDPAFTPDGAGILWSSNRDTGKLEIWRAEFDPSRLQAKVLPSPQRVSSDGENAENPTMSVKTNVVVYASSNQQAPGIWVVRPDGGEPAALVRGPLLYIPDVSPDGQYAAYVQVDLVNQINTLRVVDVAGHDTGFQIAVPYRRQVASGDVTWARVRWSANSHLVFIGQDDSGRAAVYRQRFVPGADTSASREHVVDSLPGAFTESLAISPDGRYLMVSDGYYIRRLMLAERVPGVLRRRTP